MTRRAPAERQAMRFAYADPPYLGCGGMYAALHPEALVWNRLETHQRLIARLVDEFPDGWALSLTSTSLRVLLPMCPEDCRVLAWCKPFVAFKDKTLAYAWEPVIFRGGRRRTKAEPTIRDYHIGANPPRLDRPEGFVPGMKPRGFCRWLFEAFNAKPGDTLIDMFPGSGAVGAAWAEWVGEKTPLPMLPLEAAP